MCLEVERGVLEVVLPGRGKNDLHGKKGLFGGTGGRGKLCFLVNLSNTLG